MAIQLEIWAADIAENLFPDNAFYAKAVIDDAYVVGKTVHVPNAGSPPGVTVNRSSLPATAAARTDTDLTYTIDELTTDPSKLGFTESAQIAYDKRISLLKDHIGALQDATALRFAYAWGAVTNIIRTTGTARAAYKSGQTGDRKAITKADILNAQRILNGHNVPQSGRIMLIDSDLLVDLLSIDEFMSYDKLGYSNLTEGAIGRILGFDVMIRSWTVLYTNAATPVKVPVGTATAATHNVGTLFWHPGFVRRALGTVQLFEDLGNPLYYGDIFSALALTGGAIGRNDEKGVVTLVEAAA